jgi:4'-phosphopantetheinyl transferase
VQIYWLSQTLADVPLHDDWLSARERGVLSRLRQPKRREDWRLGRWTAKTAFAIHQGVDDAPEILAGIEVSPGISGAPVLIQNGGHTPYVVSLSHSRQLALCALAEAGTLLGCDVELVEPRSEAFLAEYFTPEEQSQAMDDREHDALVSALWSAKESALKALGCGLNLDLLRVHVKLGARDSAAAWRALVVSMGSARIFEGWWRIRGGFVWTMTSFPAPLEPLPLCSPV